MAATLACLLLAGPLATAAAADAARPGHYRSQVTSIEPAVDGLRARIVGGDAFLEVTAPPGRSVTVLGYQDEPYVLFEPGGPVLVNTRSPTHHLNDDRSGRAPVPDHADPAADPAWQRVGGGPTWAWHDHRVHWMLDREPPAVRDRQGSPVHVSDWEVALLVDGESVVIHGSLEWRAGVSPVGPAAVALVLAAAVALGARRLDAASLAGVVLLGAGAIAAAVTAGELAVSPRRSWDTGAWLSLALAATAVLAAAALLVLRRRAPWARTTGLASAAAALGWAGYQLPALTAPVVPTELPVWLARAGVAAAGALAASTALLLVLRPRV